MVGFPVNMRNARLKAGLTQAELAEKVNVTQAMIARCENGSAAPSICVAVQIANALGTTCEALVEGEDVSERNETV